MAWKRKKKGVKKISKKKVSKKVTKRKRKEETPVAEQYYNQAINTAVKKYLLLLDYKIWIVCEGNKARLFKTNIEDFKALIEDILDDYYEQVEKRRIPSPHAIFTIKRWIKRKEIEVLIHETHFVGLKDGDLDLCKYYKKYF